MKNEYVIINKNQILKRIEKLQSKQKDLEKLPHNSISTFNALQYEINKLKQILSQSTPLIPEIEKAFDAGRKLSNKSQLYTPDFYWTKQDYISNLKLDI